MSLKDKEKSLTIRMLNVINHIMELFVKIRNARDLVEMEHVLMELVCATLDGQDLFVM
jgi:hypothetical protein